MNHLVGFILGNGHSGILGASNIAHIKLSVEKRVMPAKPPISPRATREQILGRKSGTEITPPTPDASIDWAKRKVYPDPSNGGSVAAALSRESVTGARFMSA